MRILLASLALALFGLGACGCGSGKSSVSAADSGASAGGAAQAAHAVASGMAHGTVTSSETHERRGPVFNFQLVSDADADGAEVAHGLDADDFYIERFGPAAKPADRATIAKLFVRYFGALAHEQYSAACSLMFRGLENLVAETYSQTSPSQLRGAGMTCAAVLYRVFAGRHRELVEENSRLRVAAVRVHDFSALVILRFGPVAVRRISAYREGGVWKVGTLQVGRIG